MKYKLVFCFCLCSVILSAQQANPRLGQRIRDRLRSVPRINQDHQPSPQPGGQHRPPPPQPGGQHRPPHNLDLDGDGVLSRTEILAAVRSHLNNEKEYNPHIYKKILQHFDTNKDDVIDDDEAIEVHYDLERRMQRQNPNMMPMPGDPPPGPPPMDQGKSPKSDNNVAPTPGKPRFSDNGLLKGVKIEGLDLGQF